MAVVPPCDQVPDIPLTTLRQVNEANLDDPRPDRQVQWSTIHTGRVVCCHSAEGLEGRNLMGPSLQRPLSACRKCLTSITKIFTAGRIGAMMGLFAFIVALVALLVAWYTYNITIYASCLNAKDVRTAYFASMKHMYDFDASGQDIGHSRTCQHFLEVGIDGMVMPLTPKSPGKGTFTIKARASLPESVGPTNERALATLRESDSPSESVTLQAKVITTAKEHPMVKHPDERNSVRAKKGKERLGVIGQENQKLRVGRSALKADVVEQDIRGENVPIKSFKEESQPRYDNGSLLEIIRLLEIDLSMFHRKWMPTTKALIPAVTCALTLLLSSINARSSAAVHSPSDRGRDRVLSWPRQSRWASAIDPYYPWSIITIILLATTANGSDKVVELTDIPWLCAPPLLSLSADKVYLGGWFHQWRPQRVFFDVAASLCNAYAHAVLFGRLEESFHIGLMPRTIMLLVTVRWPKYQSLSKAYEEICGLPTLSPFYLQ